MRSYGPGDSGARKFGSMTGTKLTNPGIVPKAGEQIVSGRHLRDKSFDQGLRKTDSFADAKSLHGYRGYSQ